MTDHHDDLEDTRRAMTDPAAIKAFVLAGYAYLTLVNAKTGTRFTYRVNKPEKREDGRPNTVSHFVALLTRPDNNGKYEYLGQVFIANVNEYVHGHRSKIGEGAPGAKAFAWFYKKIVVDGKSPADLGLEVWHEGKCGKCGRKLTVPESIARGIGPECYARSGGK